jgi:hypothetical protein
MQAVFMIGTQRSGSNLLRLMLDQSKHICAPHPPHLLKLFLPLLGQYGDLSKIENFRVLANDVCEFVAANPVEWQSLPNADDLIAQCPNHSLVELANAVYAQAAMHKKAAVWVCKSLANVEFIPQIEAAVPTAKYIYLYRDGRDVAVSFTKAIVGEKHWYNIAKQWHGDQQLAIHAAKTIPESRFFQLCYEDLIQNPEAKLAELCQFLGVAYQANMLDYFESKESQRTAEAGEMWANVVKPVLANNQQKFRREAQASDVHIFERVAHQSLETLGYPLTESDLSEISPNEAAEYNSENQRLKQEIRVKTRPEDLQKRAKQEQLIQEIQQRSPRV